jgi:PAS domain S-box-containing protein
VPTLNPNKLFPRLSIRWKLTIAFLLLAGIPVLLVGVVGALSALKELRAFARESLQHDLLMAEAETATSLQEVARHVGFLQAMVAREWAGGSEGDALERFGDIASLYMAQDSSALFRVLILDASGIVVAAAQPLGADLGLSDAVGEAAPLYAFDASRLAPKEVAFRSVELRASRSDSLSVLPAVAVIRIVEGPDGILGAIVGEARADGLFRGLEVASPQIPGVTGLLDPDGFYLYHTEWKQDWSQLLSRELTTLEEDFGSETAAAIRSADRPMLLEGSRDLAVAARPLSVAGLGRGPLVLFRAVPLSALDARVADLLGLFFLIGSVILASVLGLAVVASNQITAPILKLQVMAHQIAGGTRPDPVVVETNDEIEDLADDFGRMAVAFDSHRRELEALVEERTTQLREAQAWLRQLVSTSADGIVGLDAEGRVQLWNRGAQQLFGYHEDEARERKLRELLGTGTGTEARYIDAELGRWGAVVDYRTRRSTKNGEEIPVSLTKTEVRNPAGEVVGYSVIFRDDRPRELLEEQMRSSERLAAISLMAAGLAHELNNPLSVLGNRIELMQRDALARGDNEQFRQDLDVLGKHVKRIGSVTGDLLRFARDGADDLTGVDVNAVAERVLRLLRRVLVAEGIDVETEFAEGLGVTLGNENVLETVLVNLLLNAQQASPDGGRVVLETRTAESGSAVQVVVRDSGEGVPPDLRRRIFEPFFTTKAGRGGTGLGLAVCRALVDRIGGSIEVDDAPEGGAAFIVTMPLDAQLGT